MGYLKKKPGQQVKTSGFFIARAIILNTDIRNYRTNSALKHLLRVPRKCTATYGKKSIKQHCPNLWNETVKYDITIDNKINNNVAITQIFNVHQFRRILKEHLLYSYSLH